MKKNRDNYNRFRNRTVAFRASEEEWKLVSDMADISGMQKQHYLINRVLGREIKVYANSRLYKMLAMKMEEVLVELKRLASYNDAPPELWILIEQINKTLYGLKGGESSGK